MTKEITKANIIRELQDKFGLREFEPERFAFSERVIPTYDIGPHVRTWVTKYVEHSITGTGAFAFYFVPDDERWRLRRYDVVFMGAGGFTVAGVLHRTLISSYFVYLDLTAAQTVSYHVELSQDCVLGPGEELSISIDGFTSVQALRLYVTYEKEELK